MRFFSIILLTVFVYTVAHSQPLRAVPYDMMVETADELYANQDYFNAIEWYEKAYRESRDKDMAARIAILHFKIRNYQSAENFFKRILTRDPDNIYLEYRYLYGKTLKAQEMYDEAIEQFNLFIESSPDTELKKLATNELKGIIQSTELEDNIDVVIEFGGNDINSAFTEYSPAPYSDGSLYFAAIPAREPVKTEGNNEEQFSRIFYSVMSDKGYEEPTVLGTHINREGFHTGNVSFSKDGGRMYFTRAQLDGNELIESKLYVSFRNGSDWSPAVEVAPLNGNYIIKHPAPGELFGNEVIFFSSDMDGGHGGFDLYYSTIRGEGDYSAPVNLGEVINTSQDEITPFYHDGHLYFSSDGLLSLGGFDIYHTTWDGTGWSTLENMGFNYNTSYDDMFLSFNDNKTRGFIVSNRPVREKRNLESRTCCDDIYIVTIRDIVIDLLAEVEDMEGPLKGAQIALEDLSGAVEPKSKVNSQGNDFRFLLDSDRSYKAVVTREDYIPDTIEFNTAGIIDDYTVRKKVILEKAAIESEVEIVTINQPIRLNNIYYDFDEWDILPDAEIDLQVLLDLMNEYTDMVIELSSHTDAQGISSYNEGLSQKRAESAKNWLVERGIAEERIVPVGYGEKVILNHCVNGVRCSDDEHRFNRRTEFKIIAGPETIEIRRQVVKDPGN